MFFTSFGKSFDRENKIKKKRSANVITQTCGCIFSAIKNNLKRFKDTIVIRYGKNSVTVSDKKTHWLDYADSDRYSPELISDVKGKIFLEIHYKL